MPTFADGESGLSVRTKINDAITLAEGVGVANSPQVRTALNASGEAPIYACRAWVNFNGNGTVAIRASGNVTSITDNAAGDYTVNFTTALPDANFAAVAMAGTGAAVDQQNVFSITGITSSSLRILNFVGAGLDRDFNTVAVFR